LAAVYPVAVFPQGVANILATYNAGEIPYDLKLLVLKIITRMFTYQRNKRWGQSSISMEGTTVSYVDMALTHEEAGELQGFKRWLLK